MASAPPRELEQVLTDVERYCANHTRVTIDDVRHSLGERSFGPLLAIVGLLAMTPLGIIPGAPTALAIVVVLIAGQLVIGRHEFWLPRFIARRSVKRERLQHSLSAAKPAARVIGRVLKPRLHVLSGSWGARAAAVVCLLVALLIPPLELVPFGVAAPAAAIAAFGVGLTTRDGLLVLIALLVSAGSIGLVLWTLLG